MPAVEGAIVPFLPKDPGHQSYQRVEPLPSLPLYHFPGTQAPRPEAVVVLWPNTWKRHTHTFAENAIEDDMIDLQAQLLDSPCGLHISQKKKNRSLLLGAGV